MVWINFTDVVLLTFFFWHTYFSNSATWYSRLCYFVRSPGWGNFRVNINFDTKREEVDLLSVFQTASGGINMSVPGHIVKVR